jgi:hypothetical protein
MVLSNQTIEDIKNASLDVFDSVTHIGVSEDTTQDGTQTLSGEVERLSIEETIKTTPDKYEWERTIGLTDAVGFDLNKVGFFSASSGNNLLLSENLPSEITKTELIELNIGFELTLDVTDNTWDGES